MIAGQEGVLLVKSAEVEGVTVEEYWFRETFGVEQGLSIHRVSLPRFQSPQVSFEDERRILARRRKHERKTSESDEGFFVRDQVGVIVPRDRPIPPIQHLSTSIQYSSVQ